MQLLDKRKRRKCSSICSLLTQITRYILERQVNARQSSAMMIMREKERNREIGSVRVLSREPLAGDLSILESQQTCKLSQQTGKAHFAYMCICVGPVLHIHFCLCDHRLAEAAVMGQDCLYLVHGEWKKRKKSLCSRLQDIHKVLIITSNFKLF